jgi:hypothetical protein
MAVDEVMESLSVENCEFHGAGFSIHCHDL